MKKTLKFLLLAFSFLCFNSVLANATMTHKMESVTNEYAVLPSNFDWSEAASFSPNIVWVIRSDFDLGGITVNMPVNVTLQFEGGTLSNGTLRGNNTKIEAPLVQIFETSILLSSTFVYDTFYPEWYGAKGDLSVDDYAAINAACQNANHVTLSQEYLMATDQRVLVDRTGDFTLLGYGSLITNTTTQHIDVEIFQFLNLDTLTIKGITINGQQKMANAIRVDNIDAVTFKDITISNLLNINSSYRATGIQVFVRDGSVVYGDNLYISEIGGGQNDSINVGVGIARALYYNINHPDTIVAPRKTKITMTNSVFEWVYGDDGDVIDIIDEDYISDAAHRFIFDNCTIRYASRRLVKGSASGIQYYNCKFDSASEAELLAKMGGVIGPEPSGGVNFRNASPLTQPNFRNMHGKMINCEYRNSGNFNIDSGTILIAAYTDGVEIRGNQFYDTYLRFQDTATNFKVIGNSFYNANIELNVPDWDIDLTHIDSENEGERESIEWKRSYITDNYGRYDNLTGAYPALINSKNNIVALTVRNNKVFSDENVGTTVNFFGLIRHVTDGTATQVYVSNNEIVRMDTPRNEFMISLREWDETCKIFDNFNNRIGNESAGFLGTYPNAGYNFSPATNFNGVSWGNVNGNGDPTSNTN